MKSRLNYFNIFRLAGITSVLVVLLTITMTAIDVALRRYTGDLVDVITADNLQNYNWRLLICLVVVFLPLKFFVPYLRTLVSNHLQEKLYTALERKGLRAEQNSLEAIDAGMASTWFVSDVGGIVRYTDRILRIGIPDVFTFLFSTVILMIISPWLGAAAVLSSIFPVLSMLFMSRVLMRGNTQYQQVLQRINQKIAGYFYNLDFIKANGMEEDLETENDHLLKELLKEKKGLSQSEAMLSFPMMISSFITILVISVLGGYLVMHGSMSLGELFTAITLADYIVSPVMRFQNTVTQIRRAEVSFKRINSFLTLPDERNQLDYVQVDHPEAPLAMEVHDLCFTYPNGKTVFHHWNGRWQQGKLHVIAGENGAGKSTLLKLLSGIYIPQNGSVQLYGLDALTGTRKERLRSQLLINTQQNILVADTVSANLTSGRSLNPSQIEQVCQAVGIHSEIMALPDGYDTLLGPNGDPLSGGQKRRICLARDLLRDALICIFDEPTAGVDPEHIRKVIDVLKALAEEKLVIVITHEPMLIQAADTVTRLEVSA